MTALAYDPAIIGPAISDINTAAKDLHQIHAEINQAQAKVKQTWVAGTDLHKYEQYHVAWEGIFDEISLALGKLGVVAQGCLDNAMQCQTANANMWPDV